MFSVSHGRRSSDELWQSGFRIHVINHCTIGFREANSDKKMASWLVQFLGEKQEAEQGGKGDRKPT